MHWVHENYWQPGPQGNDIQKTNVPNLRMRFRFDNHQEEVRGSRVREREREKHYISSSNLGLIRCLAPIRARVSHTHPNV